MTYGNYYLSIGVEGKENASDLQSAVELVLFSPEELEEGWGFCDPMNLDSMHEDIMQDLRFGEIDDSGNAKFLSTDRADGCIAVRSEYPRFNELMELFRDATAYYNFRNIEYPDSDKPAGLTEDELNKAEVSAEDFFNFLENNSSVWVSICEIEPP